MRAGSLLAVPEICLRCENGIVFYIIRMGIELVTGGSIVTSCGVSAAARRAKYYCGIFAELFCHRPARLRWPDRAGKMTRHDAGALWATTCGVNERNIERMIVPGDALRAAVDIASCWR